MALALGLLLVHLLLVGANWSYKKLPDDPLSDPAQWTRLGACGGRKQSPINISTSDVIHLDEVGHLTLFQPLGSPCRGSTAIKTKHGVRIEMEDCKVMLQSDWLEGVHYLLQMHMHTHAEHFVDGVASAMELHIVFRSLIPNSGPLVIGVMYQIGERSELLDPLVQHLNHLKAVGDMVALKDFEFDYSPDGQDFYEYLGSFTTPPCTERVHWLVQVAPRTVSAAQLRALEDSLRGQQNGFDNVRPLQPRNGREVLRRRIQSCASERDGSACLRRQPWGGAPALSELPRPLLWQALAAALTVLSGWLAIALHRARRHHYQLLVQPL